jgi:hypothetical protein
LLKHFIFSKKILSQRNADHQGVTMKTIFTNAAVRGPLNVYGKVNSKNLNNIVLQGATLEATFPASTSSLGMKMFCGIAERTSR